MGNLRLRFQPLRSGAKFKRGLTSLEDDPREGRPKSATTTEITEQVHDMVLDHRRQSIVRNLGMVFYLSKFFSNLIFIKRSQLLLCTS